MILCLSLTGNAHHQSDNYEACYCKWRHSLGVFLRKPYMFWRTDGVYASGHPELAQLFDGYDVTPHRGRGYFPTPRLRLWQQERAKEEQEKRRQRKTFSVASKNPYDRMR